MKSAILSLFILFTFSGISQNTKPKFVFENVQVMNKIPGLNKKKVKQMSSVIGNYLSAIETDNYKDWYASFSDSTIARIASHKFKNKFNRLRGYELNTSLIKVVSVIALETASENEAGVEYEIIVEFDGDMKVSNRVNFDKLKASEEKTSKRQLAMNLVLIEKKFSVCIHTYIEREETDYDQERNLRYSFGNVQVMTQIPGVGQGKARRLAGLLSTYLGAIESNNYDAWYGTFSDSTIARVAPHKFPNKFKRLKGYGITTDTIKIISATRLSSAFENETGREYEIVIELEGEMEVANRVSFDRLKRGEANANKRRIAVNVIANEKGFQMIIHKYGSDFKKQMNKGNQGTGKQ